MRKYEVIIVGAGPAGLRCAEILGNAGRKVLILEKNKIVGPKVCAGGLTIKDLNMGIPDKIIQRKFKKIIINTPLQKSELKSDKPFIATILRKDLGKWMLKRAKNAGADVMTGSEVTQIKKEFIVINNKEKVTYEFLIGADGSNSIVRKYLGLKTNKFLQAFQYLPKKKFKDLEVFSDFNKFGHYVWIFPYKNYTSVGTGKDVSKENHLNFDTNKIKDNFDSFCNKRFNTKNCKFEASIINYDFQGYDFGNLFLIGDAAGFASGLTGEGIYAAIKSGEDVAKKIVDKNHDCTDIKRLLSIKKLEDRLLNLIEMGRNLGEIGSEFANFLIKSKFIEEAVLKMITE